ncbi:MAG: hypothetical protein IJ834_02945 [Paludibacteraceae bacterium]|nr:hypothetical protein [Paludibacteraceae bacterium]
MEISVLLEYNHRDELRRWLETNHATCSEVWGACSRSRQLPPNTLPYLDIVEEALYFGWIDSTLKRLADGRLAQRLSPRRKNSHWTELNIQRCEQLKKRDL